MSSPAAAAAAVSLKRSDPEPSSPSGVGPEDDTQSQRAKRRKLLLSIDTTDLPPQIVTDDLSPLLVSLRVERAVLSDITEQDASENGNQCFLWKAPPNGQLLPVRLVPMAQINIYKRIANLLHSLSESRSNRFARLLAVYEKDFYTAEAIQLTNAVSERGARLVICPVGQQGATQTVNQAFVMEHFKNGNLLKYLTTTATDSKVSLNHRLRWAEYLAVSMQEFLYVSHGWSELQKQLLEDITLNNVVLTDAYAITLDLSSPDTDAVFCTSPERHRDLGVGVVPNVRSLALRSAQAVFALSLLMREIFTNKSSVDFIKKRMINILKQRDVKGGRLRKLMENRTLLHATLAKLYDEGADMLPPLPHSIDSQEGKTDVYAVPASVRALLERMSALQHTDRPSLDEVIRALNEARLSMPAPSDSERTVMRELVLVNLQARGFRQMIGAYNLFVELNRKEPRVFQNDYTTRRMFKTVINELTQNHVTTLEGDNRPLILKHAYRGFAYGNGP